jgi:hypothetical protein
MNREAEEINNEDLEAAADFYDQWLKENEETETKE